MFFRGTAVLSLLSVVLMSVSLHSEERRLDFTEELVKHLHDMFQVRMTYGDLVKKANIDEKIRLQLKNYIEKQEYQNYVIESPKRTGRTLIWSWGNRQIIQDFSKIIRSVVSINGKEVLLHSSRSLFEIEQDLIGILADEVADHRKASAFEVVMDFFVHLFLPQANAYPTASQIGSGVGSLAANLLTNGRDFIAPSNCKKHDSRDPYTWTNPCKSGFEKGVDMWKMSSPLLGMLPGMAWTAAIGNQYAQAGGMNGGFLGDSFAPQAPFTSPFGATR